MEAGELRRYLLGRCASDIRLSKYSVIMVSGTDVTDGDSPSKAQLRL